MTAETLKPFIAPQSVDNFPAAHSSTTTIRRQRNSNYLAIALSVVGLVVAAVLLGFTIWYTMRITKLETDLQHLTRVVESMQKRLGLNYLDDLHDFEKEYTNALIDDPNTLTDVTTADDDDDDDDDEDDEEDEEGEGDGHHEQDLLPDMYEEIENYDEFLKKFHNYDDDEEEDDETEETNSSDDDNLYDDFEKFQDSKKKRQGSSRKTRGITNNIPVYDITYLTELNDTDTSKPVESSKPTSAVAVLNKPSIEVEPCNDESTADSDGSYRRPIVAERHESRYSPLRRRTSRRRKLPIVKNAKSPAPYMNAMPTSNSITPAAHFHLNRKIPNRHAAIKLDSYPGDMYIGHPSWTNEMSSERYFKVDNGVLTVREPGLYYVYAQVCYNNTHDQNGFVIFHGHRPFLQCLNTVPTNMPLKIHTCHTSGLIYLQADETIHLRDFHSDRSAVLKEANNRSYFGLMKI